MNSIKTWNCSLVTFQSLWRKVLIFIYWNRNSIYMILHDISIWLLCFVVNPHSTHPHLPFPPSPCCWWCWSCWGRRMGMHTCVPRSSQLFLLFLRLLVIEECGWVIQCDDCCCCLSSHWCAQSSLVSSFFPLLKVSSTDSRVQGLLHHVLWWRSWELLLMMLMLMMLYPHFSSSCCSSASTWR